MPDKLDRTPTRGITALAALLTAVVSCAGADAITGRDAPRAAAQPSADRAPASVVALNKTVDTIFVGDTVTYTVSGSAVTPGMNIYWKADTTHLSAPTAGMDTSTTITVVGRAAGTAAWVGVVPQVKPYPYASVTVVVRDRPPAAAGPAGPDGAWRLTLADEFDGTALDTTRWRTDYPWGRTKGAELQYYAPDDVTLADGVLHLGARRRAMGGKAYTAGMIASWNRVSFGPGSVVEIRARVPAGAGLWPAFWMLPPGGAWPPELDVMEVLGRDPSVAYMTAHWGASAAAHQQAEFRSAGRDLSAGWHTYTMQWDSAAVIWYLDGVETARFTNADAIPRGPMYLIANLAIGNGGWTGAPDASTPFPATFDVDYIRAWRRP